MKRLAAVARADNDARHVGLWSLLILVIGFAIAWQFVGEAPPRTIVVATGPEGGGYDLGGQALKSQLEDSGIDVELRRTAGSIENLALLRKGSVDVAFVQGGVEAPERSMARAAVRSIEDAARASTEAGTNDTSESKAADDGLQGIASLYFEPLWIFVGSDVDSTQGIAGLHGRRLQVGSPGSGTRRVTTALLNATGIDDATLLGDDPKVAATALQRGDCDAVLLVSSPHSETVRKLTASSDTRVMTLPRAHAISRHFAYLEPLMLTPGMLNLASNTPSENIELVAPAAGWVAREGLHAAVVPQLIRAAEEIYGARGLFEDAGQFPSPNGLEYELAPAADNYYRRGLSWLYRVLPFQIAATLDRLKVLLLPLLTLFLPLIKLAPPLYRWRIRRRITKWYRALLAAEDRVREDPSETTIERVQRDLQALDGEIAQVQVPLGYTEELYNVRMHLRLVQRAIAK
ncbi:MAG: hypothetical protein KDC95_05515 [Planctomycetes bacterium]|nr:hypothetical protein [Planctomycetota bacterium]